MVKVKIIHTDDERNVSVTNVKVKSFTEKRLCEAYSKMFDPIACYADLDRNCDELDVVKKPGIVMAGDGISQILFVNCGRT